MKDTLIVEIEDLAGLNILKEIDLKKQEG